MVAAVQGMGCLTSDLARFSTALFCSWPQPGKDMHEGWPLCARHAGRPLCAAQQVGEQEPFISELLTGLTVTIQVRPAL